MQQQVNLYIVKLYGALHPSIVRSRPLDETPDRLVIIGDVELEGNLYLARRTYVHVCLTQIPLMNKRYNRRSQIPGTKSTMKALTHLLVLTTTTTSAALTYKGVDWSSLLVSEAAGHSYTGLNGQKAPLETILASNGVNTVRQRLWVNPSDRNYNLDYNLRLARRAKAANLYLYLDLHFSDTWADPAHQTPPAGWPSTDDIDALAWKLYNHTLETTNAFAAADLPIALLSLGNEITAGMLFPAGELSVSGGAYNLARMLHSASAGVKDSNMKPTPKLILHLDNGWNFETQKWWYDTVLEQGPLTMEDFDVQGVSYYPFYNGEATLGRLKESLTAMRQEYGKEVMVVGKFFVVSYLSSSTWCYNLTCMPSCAVSEADSKKNHKLIALFLETNWPTSCPSPAYPFPSDTTSIAFSAAGQSTWLKSVAGTGGISGLFYWEPAWVDNAALGSSCESNTMFEYGGQALSSLVTFKEL